MSQAENFSPVNSEVARKEKELEDIRFEAIRNLRYNFSNWDYEKFCQELGFHETSGKIYWLAFMEMMTGIGMFDNDRLRRLITKK